MKKIYIGGTSSAVLLTNSDLYFDSSRFISNNALESGGCVAVENLSNATFHCSKFFNNSARWEGGCLYAGTADIKYTNTYTRILSRIYFIW